jgi:hypothetical protein
MNYSPQNTQANDRGLEILEFDSFRNLLNLQSPPLDQDVSLQLLLIERHLRDSDMPCKSIVIERRYIDRAFIDDYSSFYSTSFKQYKNWCQRVHFFAVEKEALEEKLSELFEIGRNAASEDTKKLSRASEDFSLASYLGFSVIKPLPGSPIGRTVLRHYGKFADKGFLRKFNCTRHYKVHLLGLQFTVCGLVFQQQDRAVSACATTALWTSLSKVKEFENLRTPTPAQITKLATQHFLPFGRSMPQENGLSVEQMCQAIQALGLSPNLIRTDDLDSTKACLYSAILSGFAPILIIEKIKNGRITTEGHAVTATGMKIREKHRKSIIKTKSGNSIDDLADDLVSIYVSDDRLSPYFRVEIQTRSGQLIINFAVDDDDEKKPPLLNENWRLSHILIPLHTKIRLSFIELRETAFTLVNLIGSFMDSFMEETNTELEKVIQMSSWIMKSSDYISHLFFGSLRISKEKCDGFLQTVELSRYVGIIRLTDKSFGKIDVLIDTTNISKNLNFLAVICRASNNAFSEDLVKIISEDLRCPFIIDYQK